MARHSADTLWERVEPLLSRVERPARYLDHEWNSRAPEPDAYRVVLAYPDTYELGMANQALTVLADRCAAVEGVSVERVFVPWKDMAGAMREAGVPLWTLEGCAPVRDADLLGITLPHELTYTNVLELLDLAGIPLLSAERGEGEPLVVGGGPAAYNPEPVADFFDAVLLGEGEEAVTEIMATHRSALGAGGSREEAVAAIGRVDGVYVPAAYEAVFDEGRYVETAPTGDAPPTVRKRVVTDMDSFPAPTCPVVPYMDVVHDRAVVEIQRGCTRGCRFCQAGVVYRPVRERGADGIVASVMATLSCTGYEEVSLVSLSSADHSRIAELARRLRRRLAGKAVSVSLPSLRVDSFGVALARQLSTGKKGGLTFAPEAATQRLRDVINKGVTRDDLMDTVARVFAAGWRRVKLYFMIGLPTETDEDVRAIGEVVTEVLALARETVPKEQKGSVRVAVSVATFVPKSHTPFQWEPQISLEEVERRQRILRESIPSKGVDLSWHDPETSFLEAVLARGGRELARAVERAWRSGARFDAWSEEFELDRWGEAFAQTGVDAAAVAGRARETDEPLPWDHLSCGVTKEYLAEERRKGLAGESTSDCSSGECGSCGVCTDLGVDVVLSGERRG